MNQHEAEWSARGDQFDHILIQRLSRNTQWAKRFLAGIAKYFRGPNPALVQEKANGNKNRLLYILYQGGKGAAQKPPPHKLLIFKHVVSYVNTNAETQCADGFLSIHACPHMAEQMTLAAD